MQKILALFTALMIGKSIKLIVFPLITFSAQNQIIQTFHIMPYFLCNA